MKKYIAIMILFMASHEAQAQGLYRTSPVAVPGPSSIHHSDVFSFLSNPASLAQLENFSAGILGERRYFLKELNSYTFVLAVPTKTGNFGIQTAYAGFADYHEIKAALAYGRKLGNQVDIGATFNYHSLRISSYGSASASSFEIGVILHMTDKLHAGLCTKNPVGGKFGIDNSEKFAPEYTAAIGYELSEIFFTGIEITKVEDQPVNVNAGFRYKIIPRLMVKMGISSATSSAWLGIRMELQFFGVELTTRYHPQLGITPGLSLLFYGKKMRK